MFGIIGIGQFNAQITHGDMTSLRIAGQLWSNGLNPYDFESFSKVNTVNTNIPFAYPPQSSPLFILLSSFSFVIAKAIMITINLFCVGIISFFSLRLIKQTGIKDLETSWWFIPIALVMCNPYTFNILWQGQMGLIVTAALIGGWYFAYRNQWIIGGILIAIASMKPNLSILIILWLMLDKQWRLLTVAAMTVLVFSIVPMIVSGPIDVFLDWYNAVKEYQASGFNRLGSSQIPTIQNMLYVAGFQNISTLLTSFLPLGIILTTILWWYRSKFFNNDIFGILLGAGLLFGFGHVYDWIALAPLIAIFWIHLHKTENVIEIIAAISLIFIIFFPRRVITYAFHGQIPDLLLLYRTPALLVIIIWLVIMSLLKYKN
ncbi:MAG: DUF2029 domain-containing protein [Proteobacteria bacterium]|nr:DUF2029 domain-containing protein [Pseudomonadota bacterium]